MIINPILLNFPIPILTDRLSIRPAQEGDGLIIFDAVDESRKILIVGFLGQST